MSAILFLSSSSCQLNSLQSHSFSVICSSSNPNQNSPKTLKLPDIKLSPNAPIKKMPTAPWMRSPIVLQPDEIIKPSKPKTKKSFKKTDKGLTAKESGVRGKQAMKKIIENIEKLQKDQILDETQKKVMEKFEFKGCFEENVSHEEDLRGGFGGKVPWLREDRFVFRRMKKERMVTKAETMLDGELLERLKDEARKMRKWVKVKKAGVTESVVFEIRLAWRRNELAMVKFDVPLCRNMDRAREILELKTGGLVIWTKKDAHVVYRGDSSKSSVKMCPRSADDQEAPLSKSTHLHLEKKVNVSWIKSNTATLDQNRSLKDGEENSLPTSIFMDKNLRIDKSLYEREGDRLLDGLGPRFVDWWMWKPLPVDGDLLPEVVPGFKPPFRLSPPDARSKLTDDELTYLRKLAHPLPTHFVLGRNRGLQGLATAILKLWEKSLVAKITVKWGIPNTDNEQMANELKHLTGGVLLLRNKFLIILYRGNDFLPCGVENLIVERERELQICQNHEEGARLKAIETFHLPHEPLEKTSKAGTLSEFQNIQSDFGDLKMGNREFELQLEAEIEDLERELRKQERKLFILNIKIEKSAKELSRLNSAWKPREQDPDLEMITEEERQCLHKIGMKMNSNLLLGRRGVFDGVIEGLHQHWKYREVARVITKQKLFAQVIYTAKSLVAESGGILISVDKLKEGHAIIIYRGKNYRRPLKLMTQNLLSKRQALRRSLEMQRLGSLKFFAYQRQRVISNLKIKLAELQESRQKNMKIIAQTDVRHTDTS
ncbi:chloroplastic group IIA intron splicing facilitator CRS1 [Citrus sinensis]|uniref:chloroplastic group IIA intron splicing facilitator CRS1, chloroplastic n=1 Tax=Citrus sinensis TaxID=2711 RepID=UPI0003D77AFB|nr:chloroplastic group IIA intron splicing facilitator CRS1, chloroplastic [Citrus sinensis]XP_024955726.1 chloroplastic group IIA intron splicing facilitator CRS1, chloroplastic [Citrus sinensis]XP_052299538.1 chloroplastic group IIA intron splicing facilitator CRS1, chloroplastic [Citrus sinensis]XP_052299539.1 chloroplastic group IIA intron splicing facilitator CRS1, chloroplastic [Citrus sinensis]XP_052299540.1 chloroplastic group IIA intron splicing facilitator CRS1, chloroplastic [Citrus 